MKNGIIKNKIKLINLKDTMKLKKLLKGIPAHQIKTASSSTNNANLKEKDIEITGICSNSKLIAPGNLFIARKGRADDGTRHIPEAVATGAIAVLTDIYDPFLKEVTQIIHPDVSQLEGILAATYYQFATNDLLTIGVTGTNGKTTTTFMIKHLLDTLGTPCGLIGTIEHITGSHRYQAARTTPDVSTNHKLLREMVLQGCKAAVMEVTSHALDQGRVDCIDFDIAIFTNLTLDHLDYHQTMENYCLAKNKLFRSLGPQKNLKQFVTSINTGNKKSFPKRAIINKDSPWHQKIIEGCNVPCLTYSIVKESDVKATNIQLEPTETRFEVCYKGKKVPCMIPFIGRYNIYNALAAISAGLACGWELERVTSALSTLPSVTGRLQKVSNDLGLKIYVDFAHSDDSLTNVLECLREVAKGKLITVFGCGGDRDKTKRPKMAYAAEQFSDFVIVTSDNPRSEEPLSICNEIVKGFKQLKPLEEKDFNTNDFKGYIVEVDRRKAIEKAIEIAKKDDLILIAGKGHEHYQVFSHKTIEFDDCQVASELCSQRTTYAST